MNFSVQLNMSTAEQMPEFTQIRDFADQYSASTEFPLNFRNAPLRRVLNFLHDTADLPIEVESNVDIDCPLELSSDQPVDKYAAIKMLQEALESKGHRAI